MSGRSLRFCLLVAGLPVLATLTGCVVAADLVSPAFLSSLGFDPGTVIPSQGRVVIAFRNATTYPAAFAAVVSDDARDATSNALTVSATDVAGNDTRTMVVECPVGVVTPLGIVALVEDTAVELTYAGAPLVSSTDFVCGDVIEMRLVQLAGVGGAVELGIEVRVLAGR